MPTANPEARGNPKLQPRSTAKPPPVPGRPVRGSTTGRPLMAALDLLGRRWTLRILWELRDGALGARALRARCDDMSSSVLYERLGELRAAALIAQADAGDYELTAIGGRLGSAIAPLQQWSEQWATVTRAPSRSRPT